MGLNCHACPVRHRAACAVLSEAERDALAKSGRDRKLRRGELLFAAGDESGACATLIKGALKVTSVDENGTERILAAHLAAREDAQLAVGQRDHVVVRERREQLADEPRRKAARNCDRRW